ncbi:hypothetical protein KKF81_01335 [Candidatus Micrarchaeota archaeon]|nr:hypothetical protein [Candidatus Micrarchaeota archaeon]MBU1887373.1 hypothetical protein [Candidatus Micrarchaeota archaeon]
MNNRCVLLILLIITCISYSVVIGPHVYEQKDLGDSRLGQLLYVITVDCDNAVVQVKVLDDEFAPVENAWTYLQYIDYTSQLISKEKSDKDGMVYHKLPGEINNMRGMFVLLIEKKGYRNKEIHFDILGCLTNQSWIPPPPNQNTKPGTQNQSVPPVNGQTNGNNNLTGYGNNTDTNATANDSNGLVNWDFPFSPIEQTQCASMIPFAFLLPCVIIFNLYQRKQ